MDVVNADKRSKIMGCVRQKHTKPEILVRRYLHAKGCRFRLHRKDLPGNPDIVLPKHRVAIFVNGCFWHSHTCPRGKRPSTKKKFWNMKLDRNIERDDNNYDTLKELGWKVLVIWECETKNLDSIPIRNIFS